MNIYLVNTLTLLAAMALGYLLGSIPNGVIIGKLFFKKDPRDYYSKNSGGTNSGRVLGKKMGVLVTILDMLKAIAAVFSFWAFLQFSGLFEQYYLWGNYYDARPLIYYLAGLFAIIGHCYPIYIHFKGGKAVASTFGINGSISPVLFALDLTFFLFLKKKKMVSLSSMCTSAVVTLGVYIISIISICTGFDSNILSFAFGSIQFPKIGFELAVLDTFLTLIIIYRHRANIARIKNGTESKVSWIK